jgi:hypothetical protein
MGFRFSLVVLAATLFSFVGVPWAEAGLGDCGQPLSTGSKSTSSDALYTLRAAVGLDPCGLCVCDVDGSGKVASSDALTTLRLAVGLPGAATCDVCDGPGVQGTVIAPAGSLEVEAKRASSPRALPLPAGVAGATVELHRISLADGTSLALLDVGTTDGDGNFSFRASTGYGTDLAVVALDSVDEPVLTALVTGSPVIVDPASEFVVSAALGDFVDKRGNGPGASEFTAREYDGSLAQARAVDLDPLPDNAEAFVAGIEEATAGELSDLIGTLAALPDANDSVTGAWHVLLASTAMERSTEAGVVDVSPDLNSRTIASQRSLAGVTLDGAGGLDVGSADYFDFAMVKTSGLQRFGDGSSAKVNATILLLAEDGLEPGASGGTYDTTGDGRFLAMLPDGRYVPGIVAGDGSVMAVSDLSNEDLTVRGLGIGLPQLSGADESVFSGDYHLVEFGTTFQTGMLEGGVQRTVFASVGAPELEADGNGSFDVSSGETTEAILHESGLPATDPPFDPIVSLGTDTFNDGDLDTLDYTVLDDGRLLVQAGAQTLAEGAVAGDGELAVVHVSEIGEGDGDELEEVSGGAIVLVRHASGMTRADLAGNYRFLATSVGLEAEFTPGNLDINYRAVCASTISATVTLDANGDFQLPALVDNGACLEETSFVDHDVVPDNVFDADVFIRRATENQGSMSGSWNVASDGVVAIGPLTGAATPDGSVLALRGFLEEGAGSAVALLGVAIRMP